MFVKNKSKLGKELNRQSREITEGYALGYENAAGYTTTSKKSKLFFTCYSNIMLDYTI